jgi:hypothetical protein
MSRPLPSGSIFSIRMVFTQSTHEMSVVSGLWSSFIGGATCDMTKGYISQRVNAPLWLQKRQDGAQIPSKIKEIAVQYAWIPRHGFIDWPASRRSVRVKGIEPGMTVLSPP